MRSSLDSGPQKVSSAPRIVTSRTTNHRPWSGQSITAIASISTRRSGSPRAVGANKRDCLQRVDAKGSGGSANAFSERGDLGEAHMGDRISAHLRTPHERTNRGLDTTLASMNPKRLCRAVNCN